MDFCALPREVRLLILQQRTTILKNLHWRHLQTHAVAAQTPYPVGCLCLVFLDDYGGRRKLARVASRCDEHFYEVEVFHGCVKALSALKLRESSLEFVYHPPTDRMVFGSYSGYPAMLNRRLILLKDELASLKRSLRTDWLISASTPLLVGENRFLT